MILKGASVAISVTAIAALAVLALGAIRDDEPSPRSAPDAAEAIASDLLPDLIQEPPRGIVVTSAGRRDLLGFDSAIVNAGSGPLVVDGRRPGSPRRMVAHQIVHAQGGGRRVIRDVGRLRFVASPDHSHWHLLGIERYELRRADGAAIGRRDRKTGFCLGDRYAMSNPPAAATPVKIYRGRCGLDRPGLRAVRQGISVGYGDDYDALLEGQHIDITGLPTGEYQLVHRVNVDGAVLESDRSNNAASALIALDRFAGRPRVTVVRTCPASDACPPRGPAPRG